MNPFLAMLLGLVQGMTEFLPISSSGHLVLVQRIFGLREPMVFFDVMLHVGTLGAVCVFYWRDLLGLVGIKVEGALATPYTAALIGVGSVPTALIGLGAKDLFTQAFATVTVPSVALLVTGLLLWTTRYAGRRRNVAMRWRDAVVIGTAQGFAITPGISRSGTTIAVGMWLGLDRDLAARYSFLLAVPAIVGATVLEWESPAGLDSRMLMAIMLGTVTAAVSGFFALRWLVQLVQHGAFWVFAPYCWCVGALGLMLATMAPRANPDTIEARRLLPVAHTITLLHGDPNEHVD